jgi:hypothetical protein
VEWKGFVLILFGLVVPGDYIGLRLFHKWCDLW